MLPGIANANLFSASECETIQNCCAIYDNPDDSDMMQENCCGMYSSGDLECWDVCLGRNISQYCDSESSGGHDIPTCSPGYGYDTIEDWCTPCSSGQYSMLDTQDNELGEPCHDYYCVNCPAYTINNKNLYIAATDNGATDKDSCYIPPNLQISDDTGIYEYNAKCYY